MNKAVAAPHWGRSLARVLACLAVAAALAVLTQLIGGVGRPEATRPLTLGAVQVLVHPADVPALTPAQVLAERRWQSTPLPFSAGWTRDTVWVRMIVHNTSQVPQSAWLEVAPSRLTDVRAHSPGPDGRWHTQVSGNGLGASSRPLDLAELVFPFDLAAGEQRTVLVETASRATALTLDFAVHAAAAYPGRAERTNLLDLMLIGAELMVGLVSLVLGLALRHLGLVLLAARAFVGSLLQLQQFGAAALFLSASAAAALTRHAGLLFWATQVLIVAFIWSFMAHAGLARWMHRVYGVFLAVSLLFVVAPTIQMYAVFIFPFVGFTIALNIHLIFRGYLPAVALLVGGFAAILVNAPSLVGRTVGWVPRYFISPLPLLVTLLLLFLAVGLALRRERVLAQALLRDAQDSALRGLEDEVARRTSELRAARDEAARANDAKSVFLAKVSHELRTPLHALLGYIDLALREALPSAAARKLKAARDAGQALKSQVNDLLEHARGEHAMLRLEPAALALQSLAQRLQDRMALLEHDSGNRFELDFDRRLPPWVWADGHRIEQVLIALLTNAMRCTHLGRVTLRISALDLRPPAADDRHAEAPLAVRFEVEDTGCGMSPPMLERLFQAFERGESSDADGLGLGLPISQQLLGLMDSRLEVTSRPSLGSCFAFTLRLRRANASEALVAATDPSRDTEFSAFQGRTRQVLVLDDEPSNCRFLEDLLRERGFDVRAFAGLPAALAFVQASLRAGEPGPDLCIVDQHLGHAVTRPTDEARAEGGQGQHSGWDFIAALRSMVVHCPVLMLSATPAQAPEGWATAHGIDGHLLKPADQLLLLGTITEMLGLQWDQPPRSVAAGPASAAAAGEDTTVVPGAPDPEAIRQIWQALAAVAEIGSLTDLEDWQAAHPGLYATDARLQSMMQALDFAGIARHALGAQGR